MIDRQKLVPPGGRSRVLLHSCCAPCSGEVMEAMLASGIDYTIFFYNPNIHPEAGISTAQGREHPLRREARRPLRRRRLRHGQLVRARQGHGMGAGARRALHDVLRHALRAHRALCPRERLSGDDLLARHLALEEHGRRSTTAANAPPADMTG